MHPTLKQIRLAIHQSGTFWISASIPSALPELWAAFCKRAQKVVIDSISQPTGLGALDENSIPNCSSAGQAMSAFTTDSSASLLCRPAISLYEKYPCAGNVSVSFFNWSFGYAQKVGIERCDEPRELANGNARLAELVPRIEEEVVQRVFAPQLQPDVVRRLIVFALDVGQHLAPRLGDPQQHREIHSSSWHGWRAATRCGTRRGPTSRRRVQTPGRAARVTAAGPIALCCALSRCGAAASSLSVAQRFGSSAVGSVLALVGACPANPATRALSYQGSAYASATLNDQFRAVQYAFTTNVSAIMCNDGFSSLLSCGHGVKFYVTTLNHIDTTFRYGDSLFCDAQRPVKWFENRL
ncbi:hypothetical protein FI667_g4528, partial [Globisporangium splendens]